MIRKYVRRLREQATRSDCGWFRSGSPLRQAKALRRYLRFRSAPWRVASIEPFEVNLAVYASARNELAFHIASKNFTPTKDSLRHMTRDRRDTLSKTILNTSGTCMLVAKSRHAPPSEMSTTHAMIGSRPLTSIRTTGFPKAVRGDVLRSIPLFCLASALMEPH